MYEVWTWRQPTPLVKFRSIPRSSRSTKRKILRYQITNTNLDTSFVSSRGGAHEEYTTKLTLSFNKRVATITWQRIWWKPARGPGGEGVEEGRAVGQFPATRRLLLNARTGHRSREIQLQSHTYCTRKSSWTIALILQRRRTIANDTVRVPPRRYNCSAVVMKVGFRRGWLVANRTDVPTQSNSWNFRVSRRFQI